jgi:imidazolonepropionase-like amidohydrolase
MPTSDPFMGMPGRLQWLLFLLALVTAGVASAETTAFVRVNVIPMDRERVLRDQTVLVEGGRISAIGRDLKLPADAKIVDGRGTAYLLPGLADMHIHADTREELALMLASGITTALDMGEASNAFVGRTRAAVEKGEVPGPRVFAALAVDGSSRYGHLVVPTPEAARWAVGLAKANGYEFIKVYNGLTPEVFAALVAEAKAADIPIVGHNVESVRLEKQVAAGQSMIAHLEEFLYAFMRFPPGSESSVVPDEVEVARAVEFVKNSGVVVTADLATYQAIAAQWGRPEVVASSVAGYSGRYLSPGDRIAWKSSGYQKRSGSLDARAKFLAQFVKALADADVPLIAGTDAPSIPGLAVGQALFVNLAALESAGLSRFEAISTATKAPGQFLARSRPGSQVFGTVSIGNRADLVLLGTNPLDDLKALERPLGVMAAGRWHDAEALSAMRQNVLETYATGTP